jgi:hypothetical protein
MNNEEIVVNWIPISISLAYSDIIRPLADNQIILYNKSATLQALNINSAQWLSISIVSGNDYHNNKGFGIAANYGMIEQLKEQTITEIVKTVPLC